MARTAVKNTFVVTPFQAQEDQSIPGYAFRNGADAMEFAKKALKAVERVYRSVTGVDKETEVDLGIRFDILMVKEGESVDDAAYYGSYPEIDEDDESEDEEGSNEDSDDSDDEE